ncbi:MAG TPA: metallophosphoesterase [Stellaceae bacterium]|jgi:DNA repair exonuclease SbcCD nuclease subunit|nr:metallophosphoesterase [Stellaceae bacterium]
MADTQASEDDTNTDIVLVHSSDLHVDDDRIAALHAGDGVAGLRDVLATARELDADIVLLAGDTFDNHMVSTATIDRAGQALADAGLPIVLLPGNHDPLLTKDSVWIKGGFGSIPNLSILGITHDRTVAFPNRQLEIWGNAHHDYLDMVPLHDPLPRQARWHIAMGHGHYEPPETWHNPLRPSWLISDAMIRDTAADYLALGHWDRAVKVGCGAVPAYYSGSPEYIHTVNLVKLTAAGDVVVTREKVRRPT